MNSRPHTVIRRKVIKATARGRLTIPKEFRAALGMNGETLLAVSLVDDRLEIMPLARQAQTFQRYSDEDIEQFLEEDKLDEETARQVRTLMNHAEI